MEFLGKGSLTNGELSSALRQHRQDISYMMSKWINEDQGYLYSRMNFRHHTSFLYLGDHWIFKTLVHRVVQEFDRRAQCLRIDSVDRLPECLLREALTNAQSWISLAKGLW